MRLIFCVEIPTQSGLDAENREEVGGDKRQLDLFWLLIACECTTADPDASHVLKHATPAPDLLEGRASRRSSRGAHLLEVAPDEHQVRGMRIRQRPKQDGIDDAEYCRVGADAKHHRYCNHNCKPRFFEQPAQAIAKIQEESIHGRAPADFAARFAGSKNAAKPALSSPFSLVRLHPGIDILVDPHIDVESEFLV